MELKKVQKRAVKMIKWLEQLPKETLKHLEIFNVERRQMKGGIIEVYKIVNDMDKMNKEKLFFPSQK